jgi:hypothetical protein
MLASYAQHLQSFCCASSYLRCARGEIRFMARPGGNPNFCSVVTITCVMLYP